MTIGELKRRERLARLLWLTASEERVKKHYWGLRVKYWEAVTDMVRF